MTADSAAPDWPINLSPRWRIEYDDRQWILQVRKGRERRGHTGWAGRSYCTTRTTLIRDIGRLCGDVDPTGMAAVDALAETHPYYGTRHR